jgi:hypothetical protein
MNTDEENQKREKSVSICVHQWFNTMKQKLRDQKESIQQRLNSNRLNPERSSANKAEQATP